MQFDTLFFNFSVDKAKNLWYNKLEWCNLSKFLGLINQKQCNSTTKFGVCQQKNG